MNKIIEYTREKLITNAKLALAKKIYTTKEEHKKFVKNFILGSEVSISCGCINYLIDNFIGDLLETKAKDFDANDIEKLKKINATLSTCVKELEDVFGLGDDTDGQDKEDR